MAVYEKSNPERPPHPHTKYGRVTPLIRQSSRGTSWIVCQPGSARQSTGVVKPMANASFHKTPVGTFSASNYEFVTKDGRTKISVNRSSSFNARFSNLRRKVKTVTQKTQTKGPVRKLSFLNSAGCTIQRAKTEIFSSMRRLTQKKKLPIQKQEALPRKRKLMPSTSAFARDWLLSGWFMRLIEGTALASVALALCLITMDLLSAHNFFAGLPATSVAALSEPSASSPPLPPLALSPDPCENGSCKSDLGVTSVAPSNPVATPPLRGDALKPEDMAVYMQALKVAEEAMRPFPPPSAQTRVSSLHHALTHKASLLKTHKHTS